MGVQNLVLTLLVLSCLIGGSYPAAISPVTSQEEAFVSKDFKGILDILKLLLESRDAEESTETTPVSNPTDVDKNTRKSYVNAAEFRKQMVPAKLNKMKVKTPLVKNGVSKFNKYLKAERELQKEMDESTTEIADIREAPTTITTIVEPIDNVDQSTDPTETTNETTQLPSTVGVVNEDSEIPRLSPPIWLHASAAEAMSDPLRLPMIESYDRYDRYSHSIGRDAFWK